MTDAEKRNLELDYDDLFDVEEDPDSTDICFNVFYPVGCSNSTAIVTLRRKGKKMGSPVFMKIKDHVRDALKDCLVVITLVSFLSFFCLLDVVLDLLIPGGRHFLICYFHAEK